MGGMRLLIVEDEAGMRDALDDALRHEGYATLTASNGMEALATLAHQSVDIVLLDRDLPVLSGDAVMRTIAANRMPVRVLMLTAAGQVEDMVSGLDLGADDYLAKPFAWPVLMARLRALARRGEVGERPTMLRRGGLLVDTSRRLAYRDEGREPLRLTPKEYGVLAALMRADGGFVTLESLYRDVWPDGGGDPGEVIKAAVYSLRRKIGDREAIISVRGEGYRLR